MKKFRMALQDRFCPLHIFCRLKDRGWDSQTAGYICYLYERLVYSPLGLR